MIALNHITINSSPSTPTAVKDVSFLIDAGSVFGIVGPSKSGKSALLRTINGLTLPTTGAVNVFEQNVSVLKGQPLLAFRKKVSFVQSKPCFIGHQTLLNNLLLPLENLKSSSKKEEITNLLAFFDLQGLENALPKQLSKFVCYKLAIARALITSPDILLIEDVAQHLLQEEKEQILLLLEKWNGKHNTTIVVSTSDIDIMKQFCHQAAILRQGELLEIGDPYQLIATPSHPFTSEFLSKHLAFDLPKLVKENTFGTIVRIEYTGDRANDPILYEVSQRFGVEYNILQGRIEYIRGKALGKMYVSFNSEPELMPAVLEYLTENTHHVEVIQHD